MFKSLWARFLVLLLTVSAVALSASFVLRGLLVEDFREYLEGEAEDRIYWVIASIESSYAAKGGWELDEIVEDIASAYMLGVELKLYSPQGALIMDTDEALGQLSGPVRKRITALAGSRGSPGAGRFTPHLLFLEGREIGRMEARFLPSKRKELFIQRSNRLLFLTVLALGAMAFGLSLFASRRLAGPLKQLTAAASRISGGELKSRVDISRGDEIGRLAQAFNRMADNLLVQESLRRKLTSNIAHELRTPLSAIRGELEGMMDGLIPAERENLQSLYDETGRLRKILEGVEELASAEASALTLRKSTFDLCPFLDGITGRYGRMFKEKGVSLAVECPEGLRVNADPDRLSQIMINLLSNALKATGPGGLVRVGAESMPGEVKIEVSDTGHGIRPEDLPFVFERFYKTGEGGLGIGLTIVKELAEAHGGRVEARSEPGRGSVFSVMLPL